VTESAVAEHAVITDFMQSDLRQAQKTIDRINGVSCLAALFLYGAVPGLLTNQNLMGRETETLTMVSQPPFPAAQIKDGGDRELRFYDVVYILFTVENCLTAGGSPDYKLAA
jgi:hypothetical protein